MLPFADLPLEPAWLNRNESKTNRCARGCGKGSGWRTGCPQPFRCAAAVTSGGICRLDYGSEKTGDARAPDRGDDRADSGEERSSFLKKRSKKLLCIGLHAGHRPATASKSFLVLFFKKEQSFFHAARSTSSGGRALRLTLGRSRIRSSHARRRENSSRTPAPSGVRARKSKCGTIAISANVSVSPARNAASAYYALIAPSTVRQGSMASRTASSFTGAPMRGAISRLNPIGKAAVRNR